MKDRIIYMLAGILLIIYTLTADLFPGPIDEIISMA